MRGRKQPKSVVERRAKANTGKKRSMEFRKAQALRQMGSNNSNYNGGWTTSMKGIVRYTEKRRCGMTKDELIESYGGKCAKCGITNYDSLKKFGIRLCAHHKDGNGRTIKCRPNYSPNNDLINIQLLCRSCHSKTHLTSAKAREMRQRQMAD